MTLQRLKAGRADATAVVFAFNDLTGRMLALEGNEEWVILAGEPHWPGAVCGMLFDEETVGASWRRVSAKEALAKRRIADSVRLY